MTLRGSKHHPILQPWTTRLRKDKRCPGHPGSVLDMSVMAAPRMQPFLKITALPQRPQSCPLSKPVARHSGLDQDWDLTRGSQWQGSAKQPMSINYSSQIPGENWLGGRKCRVKEGFVANTG